MKNISVVITALFLFLSQGCEEKPIIYKDLNPPFVSDSLIINSIYGFSYQIPPLMGDYKKLYLGNYQDYQNPFILFAVSRITSSNVAMESLLDSNIIIDNVSFRISSADSEIVSSSEYSLFYFPNSSDSLFHEYETNYLDGLDITVNNEKIFLSDTMLVEQIDTTYNSDSTTTITQDRFLEFDIPMSVFEIFADTSSSTTQNRSFMLSGPDDYNGLTTFYSRQSLTNIPVFKVNYTVSDTDTSISRSVSFPLSRDVTYLIPPDLSNDDTLFASVGRAKGLHSILQINYDFSLLGEQIVVKEAKLNMFAIDTVNENYKILFYALEDSVTSVESRPTEDPYENLYSAYYQQSSMKNGMITFDMKLVFQDIVMGNIKNYGFKLLGNSENPFDILHLGLPGDTGFEPYVEVHYVSD